MLGKVIEECQHAYVKGRQIMDVVLVANEAADDLLLRNRDGVLCEFDIEKAYDHILIGDLLIIC